MLYNSHKDRVGVSELGSPGVDLDKGTLMNCCCCCFFVVRKVVTMVVVEAEKHLMIWLALFTQYASLTDNMNRTVPDSIVLCNSIMWKKLLTLLNCLHLAKMFNSS